MPTIEIKVTAGAQTDTHIRTISGPDLLRLIAAYREHAGLPASATNSEVVAAWARNVFQRANSLTTTAEREKAARNAAGAIADLEGL